MPHRDHQHIADPPSIATRHPLRFEDGDVIVKLSSSPDDWLLLHSEVLRAASDFFKRGLQPRWGKPEIEQNEAGKSMEVYTMSLVVREGVYFLETGADFDEKECLETGQYDFVDSELNEIDILRRSCYACWGCPQPYIYYATILRRDLLTATAREYRAMFAKIYEPLTGKDVLLSDLPPRANGSLTCSRAATHHLANLASIASYYGVFDRVAPTLEKLFLETEALGNLVTEDAAGILPLARVLESRAIFMEAMRQLIPDISQGYNTARAELLAELLERDTNCAQEYVRLAIEHAKEEQGQLISSLQRLDLPQTAASTWPDRAFGFLEDVSRMNEKEKRDSRSASLAMSFWREWIIFCSQWDCFQKDLGEDHPTFAKACKLLLEASETGDLGAIFDDRAIHHYASLWSANEQERTDLETAIRDKLAELVKKAVEKIEWWASSTTAVSIRWPEYSDLWILDSTRTITYTRGIYTNDTRLTKMAVRDIAPWEDEQVKPEDRMRGGFSRSIRDLDSEEDMDDLRALAALPNVSINPVSDAWVRALGMIPAPKADFSNSGICFRGQMRMVLI